MNHLKQIGLAHIQYEAVHRFYANQLSPVNPELQSLSDATGLKQLGGIRWPLAILPHMDEAAILNAWLKAVDYPIFDVSLKSEGYLNISATPVPFYYCPTRRAPVGYPLVGGDTVPSNNRLVAKCDYALNCGAHPIHSSIATAQAWHLKSRSGLSGGN